MQNPYYHVKVMGGTNAEFGEHPWAVAVLDSKSLSFFFYLNFVLRSANDYLFLYRPKIPNWSS